MPGLVNECQQEEVAAGAGGDEPFAAGMEEDPGTSGQKDPGN